MVPSLQWGQGKAVPQGAGNSPSFPKVQQGVKGPLFSCSLALSKHHSQIPQELKSGSLPLVYTVSRPLPLADRPKRCRRMAGHCLSQKQSLSLCLSVCLSLAQRKTDTQNQLEHPAPVSSGFYMGSLQPTVRLEFSKSGELREKMENRTREESRPHNNCPVLN